MGNLDGFNAADVEPSSFDVLPAGEYQACIVASNIATTKRGDGKFLSLELQVLDGQFRGRKLFDRLNMWNPNPKAVEIAKATLSAICRAVGVLEPKDSSDLHELPMIVKVVVKADEQYGDKNEIKAYKPLGRKKPEANGDVKPSSQAVFTGDGSLTTDEIPF